MINPAQYQQVLQKMPDQALMQLLKRPDKIPSQFVVQEINRRKQMRQAGQAQKQQVANAVAMQQQRPVQTTTPEGQPAMAAKHGGPHQYSDPSKPGYIDPRTLQSGREPLMRADSPVYDYIFPNDSRFDTGLSGIYNYRDDPDFTPYNLATGAAGATARGALNLLDIAGEIPQTAAQGITNLFMKSDRRLASDRAASVQDDDYESGEGMSDIKSVKLKKKPSGDIDNLGTEDRSGIMSQTQNQTNQDNVVKGGGGNVITNLDGKNSATSFFESEIQNANEKIQETKSEFNAQQTLKGIDDLSFFKPLEAAYKNLSAQGKTDVDEYNTESQKLLNARKDLIGKLEKQKRSPESIVYESLIQTGLSLMASPEANFTQALGQAGQTGFATFQNLRKEQKDLVKDLYKESFNLAKEEFNHKMKAQEIRSKYNLADIKGQTAIFEAKMSERGANREDINLLSGIDFKNQELNLTRQKLELTKIDSQINAFRADTNRIVAQNSANYQKGMLTAKFKELEEPANIFESVLKNTKDANPKATDAANFDAAIKKYSEYFVDKKANSKTDKELRLALVEKVVPEMLKNIDQLRIGEEGYMEAYLLEIDKVINNLNLYAITGGLTIDEDDA
jgi:hypothetical protein